MLTARCGFSRQRVSPQCKIYCLNIWQCRDGTCAIFVQLSRYMVVTAQLKVAEPRLRYGHGSPHDSHILSIGFRQLESVPISTSDFFSRVRVPIMLVYAFTSHFYALPGT